MSDIVSRQEAAQAALPVYFDGEFCTEGHLAEKFTASGICTECRKDSVTTMKDLLGEDGYTTKLSKLRRKSQDKKAKVVKYEYMLEDKEALVHSIRHRLYNHKGRDWSENASVDEVNYQDILNIMESQDYSCNACFEPFSRVGFEIEHIVPMSSHGSHSVRNIQLLCSSCNQGKGNREYKQWISGVRYRQVIDYLGELVEEGF